MSENSKQNKLDEFAFYALQVLNPLSGARPSDIVKASANILPLSLFLYNGLRGVSLSFAFFMAGCLTRRVAYSAHEWAKKYRRDGFKKGWERCDRQICFAGRSLILAGTVNFTAISSQTIAGWVSSQTSTMTTQMMFFVFFLTGVAVTCGIANIMENRTLVKRMGGIRNVLHYRSQASLDTIDP
jgi:hypothetical protein